jgi:DNA primase
VARLIATNPSVPKVLNYKEKFDEPWLHWASVTGESVVVVEDIPSADKLSMYGVAACALMGTHMADDVADEILSVAGRKKIIVALDRDAVGKSIAHSAKLTARSVLRVSSSVLTRDFKDMTHEEVLAWGNVSY